MAETRMKTTFTSDFMTLIVDHDEVNLRAVLTTPIEVEYVLERLKEIHKQMLEKTVPSIKREEQPSVGQ